MIMITEKGVALFEKTFRVTMETLCPRILEGLTEKEITECYRILELINSHTYDLLKPFDNTYISRKP
jgi:hypothetical protein